MTVDELLSRIARRDAARSEATLQADIRQLVLTAPFSLRDDDVRIADLETPVGIRRRIDIEVGSCLVEVKRDLAVGTVLADAVEQLGDYLAARQKETGCRYVGLLTDGADWRCVVLPGLSGAEPPREVSTFRLATSRPDAESFLLWLDGVLATAQDVPATPREIERRLGAGSSGHDLDRDTLLDLYGRHRDHPAVRMKRHLWARLLTTALGTQFEDSDELFVEHTYLVNTAEIIAHAVIGFDLRSIAPQSLLSGTVFEAHGIHGVVEPDFFDWVVHVPGGEPFVRSLARRVGRFRWDAVGGDVLKILYESVVTAPTRKRLGEYYTPDWLAERLVEIAVERPLEQRVLDPSCGSGTFLFHAARRYLAAAEAAKTSLPKAISGLSRHVIGMDLHPVAVTLARVTYLLAVGRDRILGRGRSPIQVPVHLGDAIHWRRESQDLFASGNLVVETDDERALDESRLRFPDELLANPANFDKFVAAMTERAGGRRPGGGLPKMTALYQQFGVPPAGRETLDETFRILCRLHDEGRDHIWSYFVRNLARPAWLAREDNRVDVLVGNPPWLAFRYMTAAMQKAFREDSDERGLWHGAKVATQQDLSGLFLVRVVERYLRQGGRFAFVMPNAAVDRGQFRGLRTGVFGGRVEGRELCLAFEPAWDLRRIRPHIFPRGSAVLFGSRSEKAKPLPESVVVWSGRAPGHQAGWDEAARTLQQKRGKVRPTGDAPISPWAFYFRNGATLVPRLLFLVKRLDPGPLGMLEGQVLVRSLQRANDKPPWKNLPPLDGVIEEEFLRPVLLGESIVPYRISERFEAIVPWNGKAFADDESDWLQGYGWLLKWFRKTEAVWEAHRASDRLTLVQQLDYQGKFRQQFPSQAQRVVYNKSGMHLVAARVRDRRAIIDHKLYWATVPNDEAAFFLCAVLNSAVFTELVRPYMSYGKDERDFDKHIWQLPVPYYDKQDDLHRRLAKRGEELETLVADLEIDPRRHFSAVRRDIREYIAETKAGRDVEELVQELLS